MRTVLNKKQMTEEDIKLQYITPAVTAKWDVKEHDFLTGKERQFGLDEFPSEAELAARYRQERNLTPKQEAAINQPYYSSQTTYPPRYYQRIAVNRTVDAIACGQQRLSHKLAERAAKADSEHSRREKIRIPLLETWLFYMTHLQ